MARRLGHIYLNEQIHNVIKNFMLMTSDERKSYINKFYSLPPYAQVALHQCKKIMSSDEKRHFKTVIDSKSAENEIENQSSK